MQRETTIARDNENIGGTSRIHDTRMYTRIHGGREYTRVCIRTSVYMYMCVRARVCMNFSRSQEHAHARGHGRHTSALGETLRPDPWSFLSPRFSVPHHPRVAQARTAFRISEGRATRTREGATARGSVTARVGAPGDSAGGGRGGRCTGCEQIAERKVASSAYTRRE